MKKSKNASFHCNAKCKLKKIKKLQKKVQSLIDVDNTECNKETVKLKLIEDKEQEMISLQHNFNEVNERLSAQKKIN